MNVNSKSTLQRRIPNNVMPRTLLDISNFPMKNNMFAYFCFEHSIVCLGISGGRTSRGSPPVRQIVENGGSIDEGFGGKQINHGSEDGSVDKGFGGNQSLKLGGNQSLKKRKTSTLNSNMSGTLGDIQTLIMQHVHVFMINVHN